jgi:hypothetical protein
MQHPRNLAEWQKAVERSLRANKNGVQVAVSHTDDEVQVVRDEVDGFKNLTPTAPVELNFQTSTYINESGKRRGRVFVDFPDVILSTTAKTLTVNNYELAGQDQGLDPLDAWRTVATSDTSALMAMDFTPGSTWKFRARALSGNFTKPGVWSSETSVTITSDTTPPPQPSTPVVTVVLATMKVAWDGLAAGGGAMPADFAKVEVAFGMASSPTTIIETLYEAGFVMVPKTSYNNPHYFRFRAIDSSGNIGPWSAQATAIPTPLVDVDLIISHLDAATTEIVNIGAASILSGAITSAKLANNAVDQTKLATAVNDAIAQGTSAYGSISGINSSISTLQTSVNGKNKIVNSTSDATGTTGYVAGDRWQKWSSLAAGGTLLATWRYSGSAWVAEALDPTYIPLIDIGAGTFGSLLGSRLVAGSIKAGSLAVTDLLDFAPNIDGDADAWSLSGGMAVGTTSSAANGKVLYAPSGNAGTAWAMGPMRTALPGQKLYAEGTAWRSGATGAEIYLRWYFFDKTKTQLSYSGNSGTSATGTAHGSKIILPSTTAPSNTAYAQLRVAVVVNASGGAGLFDVIGMKQNSSVMIEDGAISAAKIVIGDFANIALGSDFEVAAAVPWALHADHVLSTATKKSGTQSLKLNAGTGSRSSTFTGDLTSVKEGEQYYFKFHAYIDSAFNGGTGNSKLRIGDQTGALITDKTYANITRSTWTTTPLEVIVTVPAGVTALSVTLNNDNTAGVAYIDDIQIRRMSEASLIQNLGVEKLVASAASIDTAVIDKLYSDVVRSRRMTTDVMAIGRGVNGIVDEFFEQTDTKTYRNTLCGGWGAYAWSSGAGVNMYTQGTLTPGTARSFYFDTMAPTYDKTTYIPVEPGQVWLLKAQYTSGTSGPRATVRYIKRDGTTAYQSAGWTKRDGTSNGYGAAGSIQTLERIYTVPADIAYIMPAVQFESTCTSATVYGGATFTNMATSSLVVDGAITARNLTVTEEMWTNILHFKLLTGDEIDVNSLTADTGWIGTLRGGVLINDAVDTGNIKATAITSKHTITGALIQTIVTASRGIKLTTSSLKAYNSTGTNTFTLDASTGDVLVSTLSTSATGARVKVWDRLDGTAAVDLYTDTSGQHGSLYTQPQPGNGGYVTNIMHYTATPITSSNWTTRLTLFADETWSIDQKTHAAEVTGDANGRVYVRGQFLKNNSAVTETFVVGSTVTSANATGTYVLTYYAPVTQGTRHVLATADSASVAQCATKSATASGFSWMWSTTASSNISMRYWAVWTD